MKTLFPTSLFLAFSTSFFAQTTGLFDSKTPLELTISGNIRQLMRDKSDAPKLHPIIMKYRNGDQEIAVAAEAKTRGHFRRTKGKCQMMPLSIQFLDNDEKANSIFKEQKKMKLVMPCRSDEYVVREWLVYELFNLFTEKSFRARLVKLNLIDVDNPKTEPPFFAFLIEEEKQLANRNNMISIEKKLKPQEIPKDAFQKLAVFEYLIANTDWSIQYLQNIKLLAKDSTSSAPIAVPYDFDHAGIVDAPYARPAEELKIQSIRERRYRGYCARDIKTFEPTIAEFSALKPTIYALYENCAFIDDKYRKSTLAFFDAFFETINEPILWQAAFSYPCDPNGTGNVIIQGLKKD